MKRLISFQIHVLIISLLCLSVTALSKTRPKTKYWTTTHEILEIEENLIGKKANYKLLDKIIDEALDKIEIKCKYTKGEVLKIFQTIDDILGDNNFLYQRCTLFSDALTPRELDIEVLLEKGNKRRVKKATCRLGKKYCYSDCDTNSFIYLAIADVLKLPMSLVIAPRHAFVRFDTDSSGFNGINWETTSAEHFTNELYKTSLKIKDEDIKKGIYLRSLTRPELLGVAFINAGIHIYKIEKNDKEAVRAFSKGIYLAPTLAAGYINRALAYRELKKHDKAIKDFSKYINDFNNQNYYAFLKRGESWFDKSKETNPSKKQAKTECLENAISDYSTALSINPRSHYIYYKRSLAHLEKGDEENYKLDKKMSKKIMELEKAGTLY